MKIKMLKNAIGPNFVRGLSEGDIATVGTDVDEKTAAEWIAKGFAQAIAEPAPAPVKGDGKS